MKSRILPALAALLIPACDEKPAEPVVTAPSARAPQTAPPAAKNKLRPPIVDSSTAKTPATPPPPPLSREDLNALYADYEALAKKTEEVKTAPAGGEANLESLQATYKVLNARRSTLLSGRTLDEKREIAKSTGPTIQRIDRTLKKHLLERAKKTVEDANPDGVPEDNGVPPELLDPADATIQPEAQAPGEQPADGAPGTPPSPQEPAPAPVPGQ